MYKRQALANKETLVCAGELVMSAAEASGAEILPVDSEHSALFQSLEGCRDRGGVKRLILTCSGGPFYGRTASELKGMTREDALQHPNWSMGAKITVDSATLMNKGLEFIEAMHLYHMPPEKISIVIHRESIIPVSYTHLVIRLGFPQLTEERRRDLTKQVHKYGEEGKVALRNIRREAMDEIKKQVKKSEITEDDQKQLEKELQDLTDKRCKEVDELTAKKEQELMAV